MCVSFACRCSPTGRAPRLFFGGFPGTGVVLDPNHEQPAVAGGAVRALLGKQHAEDLELPVGGAGDARPPAGAAVTRGGQRCLGS